MMVYICDRCGEVIHRPNDDDPERKILCYGVASYDIPDDGGELEALDLCENCASSFLQWKRRYQPEERK